MSSVAAIGGDGDGSTRRAAAPMDMTSKDGLNVSGSTLEWSAPTPGSAPRSKIGQQQQKDRASIPRQNEDRLPRGLSINANPNGTQGKKVSDSPAVNGADFTDPEEAVLYPTVPSAGAGAAASPSGHTPLKSLDPESQAAKKKQLADNPINKMSVDQLRNPYPVREEIPSNHKLTDPVAMSSIEERTLTEFDHLFRAKNYHMGVLTGIELGLMILLFQYPWHPDTGVYDSNDPSVWIIQTVISGITAWHLWKIWEYYQLVIVTDRVKYSLRNRDGIWNSFRLKYMVVEMILVVLHSAPYVMEAKPSLFIFGRMYQLFRVIRDHSPVYQWRKKILTNGHLSGLPEFDVSLTLRTYFHLYPLPSLFLFISWWILTLSYATYIFERDLQVGIFTYANTIYFTAGTMATLGYGDLVPMSNGGRTIAMVSVVVGILCSALLVTALLRQIKLTPNQVRIAEYVAEETLEREEAHQAALLIQKAFRKWSAQRKSDAYEGVEILAVTDDGISHLNKQSTAAGAGVGARTKVNPNKSNLHSLSPTQSGVCGTCCGLYAKAPTDQDVLNAAKKNREMRYYRFLTNMANSSNINPITTIEQRMERIEDMMLYMLEQLATMQSDAAMAAMDASGGGGVSDDLSQAATTENSPKGSATNSRAASRLAQRALATVEHSSILQQTIAARAKQAQSQP